MASPGPPWRGMAVAAAQPAALALWTTLVYSFAISPLRRLPEPAGGHWLLGHGRRLIGGLPGVVLREW